MAVGRICVFWLSLTSSGTTFFQKPPTTFLTCFSRELRGKSTPERKNRLNRVSNSQPPGHESDTLATESPGPEKGTITHLRDTKQVIVYIYIYLVV